MATRKKTNGRKTSSARAKKTDLTVVKGGTAVAETSKKSTAVATIKKDSKAEAKETAAKEEAKVLTAKVTAAETKAKSTATKAAASDAKTAATKTAAEKKSADKVESKKPATRRGGTKKAEAQKTEAHYFEIGDDQVSTEDVVIRIKDAYKAEGHQIGRIKKIDVYYNFEERRAYYVINDNAEGKFVEF